MRLRPAAAGDAVAIAALHADSWRRSYRGALRDEYLDGDIVPERVAVWRSRLVDAPAPGTATITTWCAATVASSSSCRAVIGSSGG
jgi:hypothetical protein